MKKLFTLMLIVTMLVMSTSAVFASNLPFEISEMKVGLQIDGQIVEIPEGYGKVVVTSVGRTIVPVRFLSEALGYEVTWDGETSTVGIEKGEDKVEFPIGATEIQTKNGLVVMELPAFVMPEENRIYVPVRFASEALGVKVEWKSHKMVEGSQDYDYDFYVVLSTEEEKKPTMGLDIEYWTNLYDDDGFVAIMDEAEEVTETYSGGGMILIGEDNSLNANLALLRVRTAGDELEFIIRGWDVEITRTTIRKMFNLWTPDGEYIWNALNGNVDEDISNDEWWVAPNGTQVFMTDKGEGFTVKIKK